MMTKHNYDNKKIMRVFITQACDAGNKGDQGIVKSEIAFVQKLFPNSEISVATWWSNELLKKAAPQAEIHSPLIDFKVKGKEVPFLFFPPMLVITFFLSLFSVLLLKANLPPIYRSKYIRALGEADIVLSSGHQPFFETSRYGKRTVMDLLANFLVMLWGASDVFISKKVFNKRVATFPQSVGPFNTFLGKCFARFIFGSMDVICVRENISKETLKSLGVKTPVYSLIDMGFFYQSPPSENRVPFRGNMIGASPCFVAGMTKAQKDHYISVMSETLAQLAKQYSAKIVLLPSLTTRGKAMVVSGREDDFAVSNLILNVMADQFRDIEVQICYTDSVDEFVNTLSHLDMLVSTRMHPTIFAAGVGVPFVEVIYEHKQVGLLKNLNLPEVGISVSDITVDSLFKRSVFVWENRDSIRRHLTSTITSLKSKNGRILGSLITSLATN